MNTRDLQKVNDLRRMLQEGEVQFTYQKMNGERRDARGTTRMDMIPEEDHPKGCGMFVPDSLNYYDLDKNAWRSFKIDNLINILNYDDKGDA